VARSNDKPLVYRATLAILVAALGTTPAVVASAEPLDGQKPDCEESLQSLVDAATSGDNVKVPGGCIYREEVTIDKPLTLNAEPGAEIRGSQTWTEWTKSGDRWVSEDSTPAFSAHGECGDGTRRCLWPEQVFFDGEPLAQVASEPQSGQFAVDANRSVVLSDDPNGHTVEVSTRTGWIAGESDGVTVEGFTMKHAANDAQTGAIDNNGYSRWRLQDNTLSDAHGAIVRLRDATDLRLLGNDIGRGGQLGVSGSSADLLMQDNQIYNNNTEGFDADWEAGGTKTTFMTSLTADGNEVYQNAGPGLWCDLDCTTVTYSNNRVHHNERAGIFFEISSGARVFGNFVWENGWDFPEWGWGAGILSSSSKDVEIYDNVLAWNADGISVISQDRGENSWNTVDDVYVHDNTVLSEGYSTGDHNFSMAWLQDWAGVMFEAASNNQGANNRYWHASPEGSDGRFAWDESIDRLADFNATAGEEGGRYLSDEEKEQMISNAGIPDSPEARLPDSAVSNAWQRAREVISGWFGRLFS
jgi:nitrous oxidase accessory protein NosD